MTSTATMFDDKRTLLFVIWIVFLQLGRNYVAYLIFTVILKCPKRKGHEEFVAQRKSPVMVYNSGAIVTQTLLDQMKIAQTLPIPFV